MDFNSNYLLLHLQLRHWLYFFQWKIRSFYYIYTNEIPSELSCEHNIFTCEKIIVIMVTHKNPKSEMIKFFISIYRMVHGHLEVQNVSTCVEKYFTFSLLSLVKYLSML